jgi:hypothetical protein
MRRSPVLSLPLQFVFPADRYPTCYLDDEETERRKDRETKGQSHRETERHRKRDRQRKGGSERQKEKKERQSNNTKCLLKLTLLHWLSWLARLELKFLY